MTSLQLARRNAWRKPYRTLLLMFCVAVAILIYGLTQSFLAGSQGTGGASDNLLGVFNKAGRSQSLPMSYLGRIAADSDVAAVSYMARMRGFAGTQSNVVMTSAVDPRSMAAVNGRELGLTADLLAGLDRTRDSVLVGKALAQAQGWSVGQRIGVTAFQMTGTNGSRDWSFEIAGIFEGADASTDTYFMIARYDYINAARAQGKDMVDGFVVRPRDGVSPGVLASRIDALFANSAAPTRTQSEKQFLEAFIRQFADIGLIINLVVGAAFTTIMMIVINTMAFAVRERTFEIGVLKTLGFSRGRIMALVLGETLFISVIGGLAGLAGAKCATMLAGPALGLSLTPLVAGKTAIVIIALGLLGGLLPAVNAMRMPIINAFRSR
ncbi:MAG: ABC transporter permease [Mesorhizobium sp.]|uniref:ABC transporter permease n=1 Tax=Mesorhizobium sp. TaxID=1871066 RepID=UPI001AC35BCE|nr:ABC transporter permease [Mesorhizobium sp.]MBN9222237.1 ABC transporter permease [Mesorhizobium sp.]